ncbi:MAG TPA: DUF2844 domain-containing protein [Thermodesulfovibrionales bacterium]|nr:DUF2844 domain-containing protein [Thermodesulfovibrionales bacterium]
MKRRKLYSLWLGLGLVTFLHASALNVQAALGGSANSIESDAKALSGTKRAATTHDGYSVHEIDSGSVVLREYVSPAGVVFGVAWNGLMHPDLTQVLGSYSDEYREALRRTPHGRDRRRLRVNSDEVVVEQWGHMRNLQGRAYAPALIPPGLGINEIR